MSVNVDDLSWWIAYLQGWCDCLAKLESVGDCECCHEAYVRAMVEGIEMIKAPRPIVIDGKMDTYH